MLIILRWENYLIDKAIYVAISKTVSLPFSITIFHIWSENIDVIRLNFVSPQKYLIFDFLGR